MSETVLSDDICFRGTMKFKHYLKINCFFDGIVESQNGKLIIGESGRFKGDIKAGYFVNHGRVLGDIKVKGTCSLENNSEVEGNLKTQILEIKKGAIFRGKSLMPSKLEIEESLE